MLSETQIKNLLKIIEWAKNQYSKTGQSEFLTVMNTALLFYATNEEALLKGLQDEEFASKLRFEVNCLVDSIREYLNDSRM